MLKKLFIIVLMFLVIPVIVTGTETKKDTAKVGEIVTFLFVAEGYEVVTALGVEELSYDPEKVEFISDSLKKNGLFDMEIIQLINGTPGRLTIAFANYTILDSTIVHNDTLCCMSFRIKSAGSGNCGFEFEGVTATCGKTPVDCEFENYLLEIKRYFRVNLIRVK